MVFPNATGKAISESMNLAVEITERMETISLLALGTSIPMVPLPGIGAMIRIPNPLNSGVSSSGS